MVPTPQRLPFPAPPHPQWLAFLGALSPLKHRSIDQWAKIAWARVHHVGDRVFSTGFDPVFDCVLGTGLLAFPP